LRARVGREEMGDVACRGVQVGQGGMEVGHGATVRWGRLGVRVGTDLVATGAGWGVCLDIGSRVAMRGTEGNNTPKREVSLRRRSGSTLAQRFHGILRPSAITRNHPLACEFAVVLAIYYLKLDPSPNWVPDNEKRLR
jgi:hypothetical protein